MNEFRKKSDGSICSESDFRNAHPNVAFPAVITEAIATEQGYDVVFETPVPTLEAHQKVVQDGIELVNGKYQTKWVVSSLPAEEIAAMEATKATMLKKQIKQAVSKRLNEFVATRDYDSIVTAVSYFASNDAKSASDAATCIQLRDATWAKYYELEAAGELTSYDAIKDQLPVLAW